MYYYYWVSLVTQLVKNLPAMQQTWVWSLGWEDPWRRENLPTPVFWPGEFHGPYSPPSHKELVTTERLSLHFSKPASVSLRQEATADLGESPVESRLIASIPGHPLWSAASLILKKYLVSWFLIQRGKHKKLRPFWLLQVKAIGISIKNTCE